MPQVIQRQTDPGVTNMGIQIAQNLSSGLQRQSNEQMQTERLDATASESALLRAQQNAAQYLKDFRNDAANANYSIGEYAKLNQKYLMDALTVLSGGNTEIAKQKLGDLLNAPENRDQKQQRLQDVQTAGFSENLNDTMGTRTVTRQVPISEGSSEAGKEYTFEDIKALAQDPKNTYDNAVPFFESLGVKDLDARIKLYKALGLPEAVRTKGGYAMSEEGNKLLMQKLKDPEASLVTDGAFSLKGTMSAKPEPYKIFNSEGDKGMVMNVLRNTDIDNNLSSKLNMEGQIGIAADREQRGSLYEPGQKLENYTREVGDSLKRLIELSNAYNSSTEKDKFIKDTKDGTELLILRDRFKDWHPTLMQELENKFKNESMSNNPDFPKGASDNLVFSADGQSQPAQYRTETYDEEYVKEKGFYTQQREAMEKQLEQGGPLSQSDLAMTQTALKQAEATLAETKSSAQYKKALADKTKLEMILLTQGKSEAQQSFVSDFVMKQYDKLMDEYWNTDWTKKSADDAERFNAQLEGLNNSLTQMGYQFELGTTDFDYSKIPWAKDTPVKFITGIRDYSNQSVGDFNPDDFLAQQ